MKIANLQAKTLAVIAYVHAGKDPAKPVDDAYYTQSRMNIINAKLRSILKDWAAQPRQSLTGRIGKRIPPFSEVYFVRFSNQYNVFPLVLNCQWRLLLDTITSRLHFCAVNQLSMSRAMAQALDRVRILAFECFSGR